MRRFRFATAVVLAPFAFGLHAQAPELQYKFEVATIKPAPPDARGTTVNVGRNTLQMRNVSVHFLIAWAYTLQPQQLVGGPDWIRDLRFDITAKDEETELPKASDVVTVGNRSRMRVRALLEERCRLKLRRDDREMSVYVLVIDRGGSKLTPTVKGRGTINNYGNNVNRGMRVDGMTTRQIAESLGAAAGRPVMDETGLGGMFDFELKWSDTIVPDATGPSFFTAVREQLGLHLEAKKRMVPVTVVDSVERPSDN